MRLALPALVFALASLPACDTRGPRAGAAAAVEAPPPEPPGLVARAVLRDPDGAWSRVQRGAGAALALLPETTGAIASRLLGADARLGALVDGNAAAYAAVVNRDAQGLGWALALPLTAEGARAAASTPASDVGMTERTEGALRVLSRANPPLPVAVALAPGWLLVAGEGEDLARLGPYVYRALPEDVALAPAARPRGLLALAPHAGRALAPRLEALWGAATAWLLARARDARAEHGGRGPDFGSPEALVGVVDAPVRRRIAAMAGAHEVRVAIDAGDDDVAFDVGARYPEDPSPAAIAGDLGPLAAAPAEAVAVGMAWEDEGERVASARALADGLRSVLGARAGEDEPRAIAAALDDWAHARGDWMSVAVLAGSGLVVRTPAASQGASKTVGEVLALSRGPGMRGLLQGALRAGPAAFPSPEVATFPRVSAGLEPLSVRWKAGEDLVLTAAQGRPALAPSGETTARLGDDPRVARALGAVGEAPSFAALVRPPGGAPSVLVWGGLGAQRWARIDLSDELLAQALRLSVPFL